MEPQLAHMVYFDLTENTAGQADKLVAECHTYLKNHPGVLYFSVGKRVADLDRPANDAGFAVALHVVFATRADHDRYQTAPDHLTFIERNKANWSKVRVFDSYLH